MLWIGNSNETVSALETRRTALNAIVNNSGVHGVAERSGTVSLVNGTKYPILVYFGEDGGGDAITVSFAAAGIAKTSNGSSYYSATNGQTNSIGSGNFNAAATWDTPNNIYNGNSISIQDGHIVNVPNGIIFYSGKINLTGTGKLNFNTSGKWMPNLPQTSLKNCKDILDYYPMSTSGVYTIDPDGIGSGGTTNCYCDMTTDGGGWTLVLNYLHLGGTNPALTVKTTSLPLLGSTTLGGNESASSTTWGHASSAMLNTLSFTNVRFYGKTNFHSRIIHFKTSLSNVLSYMKVGTGDFSNIQNGANHTVLSGHTANLPASTANFFSNQGNISITNFPFWLVATYHWGIGADGGRWEVDDYPNNSSQSTYHQIWVR